MIEDRLNNSPIVTKELCECANGLLNERLDILGLVGTVLRVRVENRNCESKVVNEQDLHTCVLCWMNEKSRCVNLLLLI